MRFRLYRDWHDLPASYADLFARASADDFCLSQTWFEAFGATVLEDGEHLAIAAVETDAATAMPVACLVGRQREHDPAFSGARSFSSLSNYYTLRYAPIFAGDDGRAALATLIDGLRAQRPRYAVLHFEPLAADAALSDDLAAALRDAGATSASAIGTMTPAACRSVTISPAGRRRCAIPSRATARGWQRRAPCASRWCRTVARSRTRSLVTSRSMPPAGSGASHTRHSCAASRLRAPCD